MRKALIALVVASACALSLAAQDPLFRPLYLSGKVTLPDGSPPPEPAIVYLYCPGGRQPQAYTNDKGAFNFPVGGAQHRRVIDASRQGPSAPVGASGPDRSFVDLTQCELRAYLPGYTSSKIDLGRRSVFEAPEVGTLILTPATKGHGTLVSLNTLAAPKNARKAYEKAQKELAKPKPKLKKILKELEKAIRLYPEFAAAWNLLGEVKIRTGDLEGARAALEKATEADPKFATPYVTLALMAIEKRNLEAAARYADQAVELVPNFAEAHYYRALAYASLGKPDLAEESVRAVREAGQLERYPRLYFIQGNIHAQRGDVRAAAAQFQRFVELEPDSRAAAAVRRQLEQWKQQGLLN